MARLTVAGLKLLTTLLLLQLAANTHATTITRAISTVRASVRFLLGLLIYTPPLVLTALIRVKGGFYPY
jgi:hypothetical protein